MAMKELVEALAIITSHGQEAEFVGPIDASLIQHAEDLLGQRLPPTYRRFLEELGAGDIWGDEFYGIVNENLESSLVPNAVGVALEARRRGELPERFLPVYDLGEGTTYAIDFSDGTGGEHPVVSWHGDPMFGVAVAATDFGAFLLETLKIARASH